MWSLARQHIAAVGMNPECPQPQPMRSRSGQSLKAFYQREISVRMAAFVVDGAVVERKRNSGIGLDLGGQMEPHAGSASADLAISLRAQGREGNRVGLRPALPVTAAAPAAREATARAAMATTATTAMTAMTETMGMGTTVTVAATAFDEIEFLGLLGRIAELRFERIP